MVTILTASLSIKKLNTALHGAALFLTTLTRNTHFTRNATWSSHHLQHYSRPLPCTEYYFVSTNLFRRCWVFLIVCFVTCRIVSRRHCFYVYAGSCVFLHAYGLAPVCVAGFIVWRWRNSWSLLFPFWLLFLFYFRLLTGTILCWSFWHFPFLFCFIYSIYIKGAWGSVVVKVLRY